MNPDLPEPLADILGPAPFVFTPEHRDASVPAYGTAIKLLGWCALLGLGVWMLRTPQARGSDAAIWGLLAWALMAYTVWHIQRSRCTLTSASLEQTWMWHKRMEVREMAYAKLIRVRGLQWLIAPRLYVRNLSGKFTVIYCADDAVLDDMARLVQELHAFRTRR